MRSSPLRTRTTSPRSTRSGVSSGGGSRNVTSTVGASTNAATRPLVYPPFPDCSGPRYRRPMVMVSGEELTKDMPPVVRERRVRFLVVRDRLHGFRDRPAAAARPARVVDVELVSKDRACVCRQEVPGGEQVACRVVVSARAEVDDRLEPTGPQKEIPGHQVTVDQYPRDGPGPRP